MSHGRVLSSFSAAVAPIGATAAEGAAVAADADSAEGRKAGAAASGGGGGGGGGGSRSSVSVSSAASSASPAPSALSERVQRLRRLRSMCGSSADGSAAVSAAELVVTLAYLSRSLTAEESAAVHRALDDGNSSARAVSLPMAVFEGLLGDLLQREEQPHTQTARGAERDEAGHRAFVAFAVERLQARLSHCLSTSRVQERVQRDAVSEELASARQQLRSAEQSGRVLAERVERLTAHCRRVEDDNARLAQLCSSSSARHGAEADTAAALHSSLSQYAAHAARAQAALSASEALLSKERSEHQHALALLQMERSAKKALGQEQAALREQLQALQQARSTEMRTALKRKKEEMAAIMDSHRYTKQIKAQAARVTPLELELQQARATIGRQQDDLDEYARLLKDWRLAGAAVDGAPAATRTRPAFSLSDDLDLDDGAAPAASPTGGHSRAPSSAAPFVVTGELQRLSRRSSGTSSAEIAGLRRELSARDARVTELSGLRDALLLSTASLGQEKEELEQQLRDSDCAGKTAEDERRRAQAERESAEEAGRLRERALREAIDAAEDRAARLAAELQLLREQQRRSADEMAASSSRSDEADAAQRSAMAASLAECRAALERFAALYPAALAELEATQRREREWEDERRRLLDRIDELQRRIDDHRCPAPPVLGLSADADAAVTVGRVRLLHSAEDGQPLLAIEADAPLPALSSLAEAESAALWPSIALSASEQVEVDCYARFVNSRMQGDADLVHLLPVRLGCGELLGKVRDGLLLAKLLNHAVPGLIDERALNGRSAGTAARGLGWQELVQNLNLVISAAKAVGVVMRSAAEPRRPPAFTPLTVAEEAEDPLGSARTSSASVVALPEGRASSASTAARPTPLFMQGRARARTVAEEGEGHVEGDDSAEDGNDAAVVSPLRSAAASAAEDNGDAAPPGAASGSAGWSAGLDLASTQLQLSESSQPALVLDFLHQIVRLAVLGPVDVRRDARLAALSRAQPAVAVRALSALQPEQLLVRWINLTLDAPHSAPLVSNLSSDLQSGAALHALLDRLLPSPESAPTAGLPALIARLDAREVAHFHSLQSLSGEHGRLQALLVGVLFRHADGLPAADSVAPLSQGDAAAPLMEPTLSSTSSFDPSLASASGEDAEGGREECAFRMWVNSAGIPGVHVHSLFTDCRDGLLLLRLIDWVEPGCVDWKMVEKRPLNKFACVTNCNVALGLCKDVLRASLVGIGGEDIHDGSHKFILAVIWQLVRYNAIKKVERIRQHNSGGDAGPRRLTDGDILAWANAAVALRPHPVATATSSLVLRSWRDSSCTTSIFLLNLLHTLNERVVEWTQVHTAAPQQDGDGVDGVAAEAAVPAVAAARDPTLGLSVALRCSNARYAISVARKLGAEAFLMPEDIVECKPKMLLMFVATIMNLDHDRASTR